MENKIDNSVKNNLLKNKTKNVAFSGFIQYQLQTDGVAPDPKRVCSPNTNCKNDITNNNHDSTFDDNIDSHIQTSTTTAININKSQPVKESSSHVAPPKTFNSLNELTEEELLELIKERQKAAALVPVDLSHWTEEHSKSKTKVGYEDLKKSTRRVSEANKANEKPLDLRRKSLPSSKNFLQGFLQNFILSATEKPSKVKEIEQMCALPEASEDNANITETPVDFSMHPKQISSPETENPSMETAFTPSKTNETKTPNISINRTPVASGSCGKRIFRRDDVSPPTTPEGLTCHVSPTFATVSLSSPELKYPTESDFGCVSPIPTNELLSSASITFSSNSPKVCPQSPILSCSFTDPAYHYTSESSDLEIDCSFERDFEPDLISFEDPALEKSPFIKYSVELRAKLAARFSVSSGDGIKPSPFLFSPRGATVTKPYVPLTDRNLHNLKEETTLDLDNHDFTDLIPQEQNDIDKLIDELRIVGEVSTVDFDDAEISRAKSLLLLGNDEATSATSSLQIVGNDEATSATSSLQIVGNDEATSVTSSLQIVGNDEATSVTSSLQIVGNDEATSVTSSLQIVGKDEEPDVHNVVKGVIENVPEKKTVWDQLAENIESHIFSGNAAGFISVLPPAI